MKRILFSISLALAGLSTYGQSGQDADDRVTKYVTTFSNGEEALRVIDRAASGDLEINTRDEFFWYEILEPSGHELLHGEIHQGSAASIDKSKFEEGTYTLKVYTEDFVISSDIVIGDLNDLDLEGYIN